MMKAAPLNDHIGLYGKLPAHGDFIHRNLTAPFISAWDNWLQLFVSASREQLAEHWLDIYLTGPIWRFGLSPGAIDESAWAGVLMPSVDRVGRYFPFTLARRLHANEALTSAMLAQQIWFEQVEACCLDALETTQEADALVETVAAFELEGEMGYSPTDHLGEDWPQVFALGDGEQALPQLSPYWLNASLASALPSYSIWHTTGSERVGPTLFCCQGLPPVAGIASMLDGQWQLRNWRIPYNLSVGGGAH